MRRIFVLLILLPLILLSGCSTAITYLFKNNIDSYNKQFQTKDLERLEAIKGLGIKPIEDYNVNLICGAIGDIGVISSLIMLGIEDSYEISEHLIKAMLLSASIGAVNAGVAAFRGILATSKIPLIDEYIKSKREEALKKQKEEEEYQRYLREVEKLKETYDKSKCPLVLNNVAVKRGEYNTDFEISLTNISPYIITALKVDIIAFNAFDERVPLGLDGTLHGIADELAFLPLETDTYIWTDLTETAIRAEAVVTRVLFLGGTEWSLPF